MAADGGYKNAKKVLKKVVDKYEKWLKEAITINSLLLATYTRQNKLQGGTTATRLRKRTARLQSSTVPRVTRRIGDSIVGGIQFGTVYASLHIGKKGQKTVIRPKNKQYLAIPLPAAKTAAGVVRGKPLDTSVFGETFIRRSKAGNLIIFGKEVLQSGSSQGETKGSLIPLFVLKKQVTVPVRVDAGELVKWIKPKLVKDLEKVVGKL